MEISFPIECWLVSFHQAISTCLMSYCSQYCAPTTTFLRLYPKQRTQPGFSNLNNTNVKHIIFLFKNSCINDSFLKTWTTSISPVDFVLHFGPHNNNIPTYARERDFLQPMCELWEPHKGNGFEFILYSWDHRWLRHKFLFLLFYFKYFLN